MCFLPTAGVEVVLIVEMDDIVGDDEKLTGESMAPEERREEFAFENSSLRSKDGEEVSTLSAAAAAAPPPPPALPPSSSGREVESEREGGRR